MNRIIKTAIIASLLFVVPFIADAQRFGIRG